MSTSRITANTKVIFFIGVVTVVIAFLQFGGQTWLKGMLYGNQMTGMANWNWVHILISICLGFLIGMLVYKRR